MQSGKTSIIITKNALNDIVKGSVSWSRHFNDSG